MCPLVPLCQPHTRTEGNGEMLGSVPQAAEPFPLLLKDPLTREAVSIHDSIQAGLGGDGLPPTIIQLNVGLCYLSDEVTMQADQSDPIDVGHTGVRVGPVAPLGDGGVHLAFDLTHDVVSFELRSL